LSGLIEFYKAISIREYLLLFIIILSILYVALLNIGFIESLYTFTNYLVYPAKPPTKYYIITSTYSLAPFTAAFNPSVLEEKINGVNHTVVYEVLTIINYDSSPYILRGINQRDLGIIAGEYTVSGEELSDKCISCVWVGEELAAKLKIKINDTILIYSPFTSSNYILWVKGIIHTNSPLRYEFVTNIPTAQAIRGLRDSVSIAIVFLKNKSDMYKIENILGISRTRLSILERAIIALRISNRRISAETYESLSNMYLSRLGFNRDIIYAVTIATTLLLIMGLYVAGQLLVVRNKHVISIFHEQGVSYRTIRLYLSILSILVILISGLIIIPIANTLFPHITYNIIGHTMTVLFDIKALAASILAIILIISTGIWTAGINEE
jgi:hypothetical protein